MFVSLLKFSHNLFLMFISTLGFAHFHQQNLMAISSMLEVTTACWKTRTCIRPSFIV